MPITGIIEDWALKNSATWGVRRMLKFLKAKWLPRVENLVIVTVPLGGHYLEAGKAERFITFYVNIINAGPLDVQIISATFLLSHEDIIQSPSLAFSIPLPIKIPARTISPHICLLQYNPFVVPLGIPEDKQGFRLEGALGFSCYYGEFTKSVSTTSPLQIETDVKTWDEARRFVLSKR